MEMKAIKTTLNCPSSTPTLKPSKAGTKNPIGSPNSPNTEAKPKP